MKYIGILLMIAGVLLGAYVGVWLCFIGGIVQIIHSLIASPIVAEGIAWGLLRVFVAGFCGWIVVALMCVPGYSMFVLGQEQEWRRRVNKRRF